MAFDLITDCHVHVQPMEMLKPEAFELIKSKSSDFDRIMEFCGSPRAFLNYLDSSEVERAVLELEAVRRALEGKTPKKVIVVPQRIVNVVA